MGQQTGQFLRAPFSKFNMALKNNKRKSDKSLGTRLVIKTYIYNKKLGKLLGADGWDNFNRTWGQHRQGIIAKLPLTQALMFKILFNGRANSYYEEVTIQD